MSLLPFLPLAAAAVSTIGGYLGQKETNETNMQLGREQMDFQERMSSTSYQRAVQDMQSAGLNPMLAYSQGGASSPVGSMPQVQNAVGAGLSSGAQALGMAQGMQALENAKAQEELTKAQAAKTRAETLPNLLYHEASSARSALYRQQNFTSVSQANAAEARAALDRVMSNIADVRLDLDNTSFSADVARRKAESDLRVLDVPRMRAQDEFYKDLGKANPYLQQLLMFIKAVSGAGSVLR